MRNAVHICFALFLAALARPANADTDFRALDDAERAVLRDEIRAVLMANPELARPAPRTPPGGSELYADDIAGDLKLIEENREALFSPELPGFGPLGAANRIALFIGPNCPACKRAEADLRGLAKAHDLRVSLIDASTHAELARRMTAEGLPFYVLPKMMLRGHMPAAILDRYLSQGTGQ